MRPVNLFPISFPFIPVTFERIVSKGANNRNRNSALNLLFTDFGACLCLSVSDLQYFVGQSLSVTFRAGRLNVKIGLTH